MRENGTFTFTNPDDYQNGIGDVSVKLIVTGGGDFRARLTWLKLRRLHVLRGDEKLSRIGYFSFALGRAFVSFPISGSPPVHGGVRLRPGDIVLHGRGERTHHWTTGESQWGLVSLPPKQLAACAKALIRLEMNSSPVGRVLRPSRRASARLLRLYSKVCRLAKRKQELISNPEVARAIEQELLHALVNCLTAANADGHVETRRRHHADIMVRFEDTLTAFAGRQFPMPELCAAIGVPERTLRTCCTEFLGMSPARYLLLRRLNMARSALRRADPATASVAEIARNHQFRELGRFAITYRNTFGELPSTTLRRVSEHHLDHF